ncbi:putative ABC transporter permease/ATP-binding protein [Tetragenococcus halophilus subsp. halophilus]|uniref:ABC transporter permease/ATP-binding protein n=1 Tax=Tetragenococcus halophilus (strain DSM 20338 / JCM 20259 / NCIMB 9735 / NBRC 12172) TaxID=945021 RepID=A0AAN1SHI8_TETHN|nr:ABC transporter ATP-binding protein [Tetragenococcus halophilus]NWN99746.1 ABC transporter ATP-binding protein [Tetragenococcus halophilus]BAK94303.1 putative ABC transporter permease/ATP-binding protein [Tetragenococcus halophilus NBRC 12172]GBD62554.1 putative ABC transporter permease/ATP-binding protein [Tetragenococcus halophilus subsp. halophilus]GBD71618.1 putative ABC transporter permease/ATP-binding protein [Tetragenococcus halophilus subsp. halophilus]GBD80480.1 putative ABC transp
MNTFSSLKRVGQYIKPYKFKFIFVMFLVVATVGFNTALPYVTGLPTTEISRNISNGDPINFAYIKQTVIAIVLIGIGYGGSQLAAGLLMTGVVQSSMKDLRKDISHKINRLPVSYFDTHQQGNVFSRVTNDVDVVSGALQQSLVQLVNAFLSIVLSVSMMFYINVYMALAAVLMIPASYFISRFVISKSQKYFNGMQNSLGEMNGFVQEHMTGFNVIKLFGREHETSEDFRKVNRSVRGNGFKAQFISGLMMPLVQSTAYLTYIVIAVFGSLNVLSGVIVVGQLQAFIQYIWQVSQPMGNITQLSAMLQSASASSRRVFEVLDEDEEKSSENEIALPEHVQGDVEFDHVYFSYQQNEPLIEDLNLSVKAGQTVAIVGPTGAGKTTIINLLMRFYDVDDGAIKIDGIDTKEMNRSDVRSLFGMVLQDAWLYGGTIADNIRFGKLDATDYEVVDAAKTANVDHFIRTIPEGYDMEIASEGDNVSLGQKQLLTIARAIISDPEILILDEATSSVDTRLEALIQRAMDQVMKGRTSFVIAHRLSTIRDADLILVMDHGSIIEQGTHNTLLAKNGFYAELYNSQFADQE